MPGYTTPPDVQVDAVGDYARYLLPRRRLGAVRWLGLAPILIGLLAGALLVSFARPLWQLDRGESGLSRLFVLVPLAIMIPILRLMLFGLIVMAGRTEIRLENDRLTARERVGPLFWTRRRRGRLPVQRVSVGYGDGRALRNGKPTQRFAELARSAALGVESGPDVKERFLLTIGYPREVLLPIGQDLAGRLHADFREGLMRAGRWAADEAAGSRS